MDYTKYSLLDACKSLETDKQHGPNIICSRRECNIGEFKLVQRQSHLFRILLHTITNRTTLSRWGFLVSDFVLRSLASEDCLTEDVPEFNDKLNTHPITLGQKAQKDISPVKISGYKENHSDS